MGIIIDALLDTVDTATPTLAVDTERAMRPKIKKSPVISAGTNQSVLTGFITSESLLYEKSKLKTTAVK
jgi:hypothetical protein